VVVFELRLKEEDSYYVIEFANRATLDRAVSSAIEFLHSASRDGWIRRNPRCNALCPVVIEIIDEGGRGGGLSEGGKLVELGGHLDAHR